MPFDVMPVIDPVDQQCVNLLKHVRYHILASERRWTKLTNQRGYLWWRRFCVTGAIMHTASKYNYSFNSARTVCEALDQVAKRYGHYSIVHLNDHCKTTHGYLLAVLNDAQRDLEHRNAFAP